MANPQAASTQAANAERFQLVITQSISLIRDPAIMTHRPGGSDNRKADARAGL
jgi:hypothetical protein